MARSSTTDALEKFRFLVEFSAAAGGDNTTALDRAGFFECGMPKRTTSKIEYREGNDPDIFSLSAGLSKMEDITLTRGQISSIAGAPSALYTWMSSVHTPQAGGMSGYAAGNTGTKRAGAGAEAYASQTYRKDVTITVLDRSGKPARKYKLAQAFVINYVPGSDLNAGEDGDKLLESMTLAYEDFTEVVISA
jgi:phage tail-like protein